MVCSSVCCFISESVVLAVHSALLFCLFCLIKSAIFGKPCEATAALKTTLILLDLNSIVEKIVLSI